VNEEWGAGLKDALLAFPNSHFITRHSPFSMSRLLAIVIWLTAIITVGLFAWPKWRLPESISAHSAAIDHQFKITLIVIGAGFSLTHAALGYAVWRYRAKNGERASNSSGNTRVEIILAAITTAVFITLAITGQGVWARWGLNQAPPDALRIEAVAQQFAWNFRYPGADGKFGRVDPRLYNDADNSIGARPGPLGIDPADPAGKDDVVTTTLVAPVNRPINLTLRSKDVIHDFYVPALRLKQDAVPGMKINIHFTATREGRYEIACAELCGQFHHQMRAYLDVKSPRDYEEWLEKNSK
jgi:cytochrome c oxidase subunit 2